MNRIETDVQAFWDASQAWKGNSTPTTGPKTYGELLERLTPLSEQGRSKILASQADDLAMEVIHAKRRRKKQPALGKQKVTRLKLVTNNVGQVEKAA